MFLLTSRIETFNFYLFSSLVEGIVMWNKIDGSYEVKSVGQVLAQSSSVGWPWTSSWALQTWFPALSGRAHNKALGLPATSLGDCGNEMKWCKQQCVTVIGYVCNQLAWYPLGPVFPVTASPGQTVVSRKGWFLNFYLP